MKRLNPKNIARLYKINRLLGDNFFTAAYYALLGKSLTSVSE